MTKTPKKRLPGRPPKAESAMLNPVMIRLHRDMLDQVDALKDARLDHPDRSSMIRELLAEALEARREKS